MSTLTYHQQRLAKRDGEIVQQQRIVKSTSKVAKWYRPWESVVEREYGDWVDVPFVELFTFHKGDRVRANQHASFHRGMTGTIEFIESDRRIWVMRDGATSAVYYDAVELDKI